MDENLVPLMFVLLAGMAVCMGYVGYSACRTRQAVASNVVDAVLALRQLTPDQAMRFQRSLPETLKSFRLTPELLDRYGPGVRYAVYAEALRRMQIAPPGAGRAFRALRSPLLARSAGARIQAARLRAEMRHTTVLAELDAGPIAGDQHGTRPASTDGAARRQTGT